MGFLALLLKPLFLPLLKLDDRPPRLPEGSTLVRQLKPSPAWLSFQYLKVLFGLLHQLIGVVILAGLAIRQVQHGGVLIAVGLAGLELFITAFALVVARVDWELRNYVVGDRSLRVSSGALTRREVTLSYANIQNIEVSQGPLERLFGFKTLTLSTAGAGSPLQKGENLHVVQMPGLEDADAIRNLMLGMMKHEKDAGLGEPNEPTLSELSLARLTEIREAALALKAATVTR